jgi:hypothetical protein
VVAALVAMLGACTDAKDEALPPVPPTVSTTSTTVVDYSTVPLAGVQTKTTTTVVGGPGRARLGGTVTGPDGPVAGATVRLERLQDDAVVFRGDVATNDQGRWLSGRLVGGRWRIRAWRAPDLALVTAQIVFLEAAQSTSLPLALQRYTGVAVRWAVAPDPPPIATPTDLAFAITRTSVDANGVVRSAPIPNLPAQLFGPKWLIGGKNPQFTDADGHVSWTVACSEAGPQGMFISLFTGDIRPVTLAACGTPAPPTPPTTAGRR